MEGGFPFMTTARGEPGTGLKVPAAPSSFSALHLSLLTTFPGRALGSGLA